MRAPFRLALALVLLVGLLCGPSRPVLGQGGTVLAVEPAQASVPVNGEREITLFVSDADNLNAFDVQVEYNADLITLSRWEFGDLLSNLAVVKRDDLPGSFRLVATQLATPGVSGDGVLLKLTFSGKQTGSTAIMITRAEFARSQGGLSLPEVQNGLMTVTEAQPTATATATNTATPTATRTLTITPTRTSTATAPPQNTALPTATSPAALSTATLAPSATNLAEGSTLATNTAEFVATLTQQALSLQTSTHEPTKTETPAAEPSATGQAIAQSSLVVGNGRMLERQEDKNRGIEFWTILSVGIIAIIAITFVIFRRKNRL